MSTSTTTTSDLNALAKKFKSLHVSGDPVILTNVHDAHSAYLVASQPSCKAIATASWSIAATQGVDDDDMTLEQNLAGIRNVLKGVSNAGKTASVPVTCDLQDGYEDVGRTIQEVIKLGAVGANIEDINCSKRQLRDVDDAVSRVKAAVKAAEEAGVPDFVVNARTDVLGYGGDIKDVIERGKLYLDAGATTLFVWGVRVKDLTVEDVRKICEGLGGKVATQGPGPTKMIVEELRGAGVSRISMGPFIFRRVMQAFGEDSKGIMEA